MRLKPSSPLLIVVFVAAITPLPGRYGSARAISLGVPSPATFASGLGTSGTVDTTGGNVEVTAVGSWRVRVSGSDAGKLRRTSPCTEGSLLLANPLKFFATGAPTNYGTSAIPLTLTGIPQLAAAGNPLVLALDTFTLTYRYTAAAADQLAPTCAYAATITIDLSAT